MFTGIIEEIGTLKSKKNLGEMITIEIACKKVLEGSKIGDSIASNGVCLTITKMGNTSFWADLTPESLKRSTFEKLSLNGTINLERALSANSRLDGHIVSGHVDTVATLRSIQKLQNSYVLKFSLANEDQKYIVEKGSIAINGISLTVTDVSHDSFCISVIPLTYDVTNLHDLKNGDRVNIEFDQLGKYLLKEEKNSSLTYEKLSEWGY